MSVIILLAVGADYKLLLVSRFKEEIHAGLKHRNHPVDGLYRIGGHLGRVGLRVHDDDDGGQELTVIGQVGTTIGLGLLFDTLIVRSLMTPSIATLLGQWFWWPQIVRQRPKPPPWPTPVEKSPDFVHA